MYPMLVEKYLSLYISKPKNECHFLFTLFKIYILSEISEHKIANYSRPDFPKRIVEDLDGGDFYPLARSKETTLERPDFTLQLLMFVTAEKEREMFSIFFLLPFLSAVVPVILS